MNVIVLVIDRLQAGYLGCYGNSWTITPEVDRLAGESLVFDAAYLLAPRLTDQYPREWWRGEHPLSTAGVGPSVVARLSDAGVNTLLVTDEPLVERLGEEDFERIASVPPAAVTEPAESLEQTALAEWFAMAIQQVADLDKQDRPWLAWLHCGALGRVWDAPREFREPLQDEDEDDPTIESLASLSEPPAVVLPADFDPDERWRYQQAYAAQVGVFDACLGVFLEAIDAFEEPPLVILTSARGYPLGEHRIVGAMAEPLLEELTHLPLIVRHPELADQASRSKALVTPADVAATLAETFGLSVGESVWGQSLLPLVRDDQASIRGSLLMASGPELAIRTQSWLMRKPAVDEAEGLRPAVELYVKPDDRWDTSDVAARAANEADLFAELLTGWQASIERPPMWTDPELPDELGS
jgi:arylsulfatase A-like enzyme